MHFSNYFVFKELFSIFLILHKTHEKEIQKSASINVCRDFEMQRSMFLESEQLHKRHSNILQDGFISFPSKPGVLQNGDILLQESEDQHWETQTLQSDCSQLQGGHSFFPHPGTSVQKQLLGFLILPGRQNWYLIRGTAARIHMEIVLSSAALMGREGTQGRAQLSRQTRRKNFQ